LSTIILVEEFHNTFNHIIAFIFLSFQGMTKSSQKDVPLYFRGGQHRLIVAKSVAEEGLDIAQCNLVIRYENVTNDIVRLQSRGNEESLLQFT